MAQYYEVPLTAKPQTFQIQLLDKVWILRVSWNHMVSLWQLDIYDAEQVLVLGSIPIVTGVDLVGQHQHLGFGGSLVVQSDNEPYRIPDLATLGGNSRLIFVVE